MFLTIGYEKSSLENFVHTLQSTGIETLVDIRDRAQSRRKGFSKSPLSTALGEAGIEYLHLRALGDPKEGRDAARAGKLKLFETIFNGVMASYAAKSAINELANIAGERRVCLMCYEKDHRFCHRSIVSMHLSDILSCKVIHLEVAPDANSYAKKGRMLYTHQSAAA